MSQLDELHLTETSSKPGFPNPLNLEHLVDAMRTSLTAFAQKNEQRFLLLGDMLALRFHHSLHRLLKDYRSNSPKRTVNLHLTRVRLHGGGG